MKMGLKSRLILSYTFLSLLLVLSLLIISNTRLERNFSNYILKRQEKKNASYVKAVLTEFELGTDLTEDTFLVLGQNALNEGIILMVNDKFGNEIFCMSCYDNLKCDDMIDAMEQTMQSRYPGFEGEYTEKKYPLSSGGKNYGTVTLGYYGPYYFDEADITFINILNKVFVYSGVIFLIVAVVLGYVMAVRISKPITEVTQKTRRIEQGDCGCRIDIESNTREIQGLINSVNALASTLEAQQSLKKRMAGDYAHEFRTPLAAILSNIEGIMDGVFEPTHERLESIRSEILRLSRMVSQLDRVIALESENIELTKENFDLGVLVKQVASTFEAVINEKSIKFSIETLPIIVAADRDKISGVIVNLISNAVKYTDRGGDVAVTLREVKGVAVLCVSDSGVGIAEEDLPHIFEHLYRTDTSRTRDTGGSGIGLAVVKAVVAAHGGSIDVKSELGGGSVFSVVLPK